MDESGLTVCPFLLDHNTLIGWRASTPAAPVCTDAYWSRYGPVEPFSQLGSIYMVGDRCTGGFRELSGGIWR